MISPGHVSSHPRSKSRASSSHARQMSSARYSISAASRSARRCARPGLCTRCSGQRLVAGRRVSAEKRAMERRRSRGVIGPANPGLAAYYAQSPLKTSSPLSHRPLREVQRPGALGSSGERAPRSSARRRDVHRHGRLHGADAGGRATRPSRSATGTWTALDRHHDAFGGTVRPAARRREHEHVPELARRGAGRGRDPAGARGAGVPVRIGIHVGRGGRRAGAADRRRRQHRGADRVLRGARAV